jgi:deazaflavin-dependent oxidoreductase (nitroreductase family)
MPLRRYSNYLGRRARLDEALLEKFVMSPIGYQYTLRLAPRIDRLLIPRTHGRFSSLGHNRVGMVTSVGAKSGIKRTNPVLQIDLGDSLLAIGSNYGRPTHPAWSANLIANPDCEVEYLRPRAPYRAHHLEGEEREQAWNTIVDYSIAYQRYAANCAPRQIRVFRLTPLT